MYAPSAKAHFLKLDARASMSEGMMASLLGAAPGGSPYLVLNVRRGSELVRDALTRIRAAMSSGNLKKPLKVQFAGEAGVDEGGLSREFFDLVVKVRCALTCACAGVGVFMWLKTLAWQQAADTTVSSVCGRMRLRVDDTAVRHAQHCGLVQHVLLLHVQRQAPSTSSDLGKQLTCVLCRSASRQTTACFSPSPTATCSGCAPPPFLTSRTSLNSSVRTLQSVWSTPCHFHSMWS